MTTELEYWRLSLGWLRSLATLFPLPKFRSVSSTFPRLLNCNTAACATCADNNNSFYKGVSNSKFLTNWYAPSVIIPGMPQWILIPRFCPLAIEWWPPPPPTPSPLLLFPKCHWLVFLLSSASARQPSLHLWQTNYRLVSGTNKLFAFLPSTCLVNAQSTPVRQHQ